MRLFLKISGNLLPLIVMFALLLSFSLAYEVKAPATTDVPVETDETVKMIAVEELQQLNIDFDLRDEIRQASEILSKFTPKDPDGFYVYPNPQEVAAPYIPENALCTEVCILGYVISFDYRMEGVRYIASYCNDGTVRLTSSILSDEVDYVYEISSDSPSMVSCLDCNKNVIVREKETKAGE